MPCWRNRCRLLPCPAVPNPMRKGCGTSPAPPTSRYPSPDGQDSLSIRLVASMDRHARFWCENSSQARPSSLPAGRHGSTKSSTTAIGSLPERTAIGSGYTRDGGYDWSGKYPCIVEALRFGIASPPWTYAASPVVQHGLTPRVKHALAGERWSCAHSGDTHMPPVLALCWSEQWSRFLASHPRTCGMW
jgi:hypothetical protein